MNSELSFLLSNWKVAVGSFGALGSFLADVATEISGYENIGTKALLLGAVVYLVRTLQKEREEAKLEAKAREDKMSSTIEANTKAMEALKTETAQQTQYFQNVIKVIVEKEVKSDA